MDGFKITCSKCNSDKVKLIKKPQMCEGEMEDCDFFTKCECGNLQKLICIDYYSLCHNNELG